jgi:positive regulator of sigma E activity
MLSFGLTMMIQLAVSVYVKSEIILIVLQVLFTIVGFLIIYQGLNGKMYRKKDENRNSDDPVAIDKVDN